jgi:hypothetical protein
VVDLSAREEQWASRVRNLQEAEKVLAQRGQDLQKQYGSAYPLVWINLTSADQHTVCDLDLREQALAAKDQELGMTLQQHERYGVQLIQKTASLQDAQQREAEKLVMLERRYDRTSCELHASWHHICSALSTPCVTGSRSWPLRRLSSAWGGLTSAPNRQSLSDSKRLCRRRRFVYPCCCCCCCKYPSLVYSARKLCATESGDGRQARSDTRGDELAQENARIKAQAKLTIEQTAEVSKVAAQLEAERYALRVLGLSALCVARLSTSAIDAGWWQG